MSDVLENRRLYPSKLSALALLLTSGLFVLGGIIVARSEFWGGVAIAGFFGIAGIAAIVQLLPGSSYLDIGATGFTFCHIYRKTTISWDEVKEFGILTQRSNGLKVHQMVTIDFADTYDQNRLSRRISAGLTGAEGALPTTYGMKAKALAELLTRYLHAARARSNS